jgi:hypothetical protein
MSLLQVAALKVALELNSLSKTMAGWSRNGLGNAEAIDAIKSEKQYGQWYVF